MSVRQNKKRLGRMCVVCGEPAGQKVVCAQCNPRRGTRPHVDKYAVERLTRNVSTP